MQGHRLTDEDVAAINRLLVLRDQRAALGQRVDIQVDVRADDFFVGLFITDGGLLDQMHIAYEPTIGAAADRVLADATEREPRDTIPVPPLGEGPTDLCIA